MQSKPCINTRERVKKKKIVPSSVYIGTFWWFKSLSLYIYIFICKQNSIFIKSKQTENETQQLNCEKS
jgi:hypothetical protein